MLSRRFHARGRARNRSHRSTGELQREATQRVHASVYELAFLAQHHAHDIQYLGRDSRVESRECVPAVPQLQEPLEVLQYIGR